MFGGAVTGNLHTLHEFRELLMQFKNRDGKRFNFNIDCDKKHAVVETLEDRRLLAWGAWPQLMDQDLAAQKYPSITGNGQTIVALDTGTNFNHPALRGRIFNNPGEIAGNGIDDDRNGYRDDKVGWDFVNNDSNPTDDQGHGTMVGGFMVANRFVNTGNTRGYSGDRAEYQGVASGAQLLTLRVANAALSVNPYGLEKALQYCIANRTRFNITAINMSMGLSGDMYNRVQDELATLWNSGVFIGASAGNGGGVTSYFSLPARGPYAMSVGGVDTSDHIHWNSVRGPGLDLVTPGSRIPLLSRGTDYWLSGTATSYAAPFGTAAAALVKQVNPRFSSNQIVSILHDSGANIYDSKSRMWFKRLDLDNAIALAYARSGQAAPAATAPTPAPAPTPPPIPVQPGTFSSSVIQAEDLTADYGIEVGKSGIGWVDSGDWIQYKSVNFGTGKSSVTMNLAVPDSHDGKAIDIRLDSKTGPVIGTLYARNTGGWGVFRAQSAGITRTSGVRDVFLTFRGGNGVANIDWIKFN
jgi:hypothetical protein